MRATILVIEKNELVRLGLRTAFHETEMEVLAEFSDLKSALPSVRQCMPNVVLVDADFQDSLEFRVLAEVLAVTNVRVVVWSDRLTTSIYQRLVAMGVAGGVEKSAPLDQLSLAIQSVASGEYHFAHALHKQMRGPLAALSSSIGSHSASRDSDASGSEKPHLKPLSTRESEVLGWLSEGLTNREIADLLLLSVKTVETYRARLMKKLRIQGHAELRQFVQSVD